MTRDILTVGHSDPLRKVQQGVLLFVFKQMQEKSPLSSIFKS